MAVATDTHHPASRVSTGRRITIGANVAVATALVIGTIVGVQWIGYEASARGVARWDMTSSRINSLSEATTNLLRSLEKKVTLTSLYFETDLEAEDQPLYRRAVNDLLELYQSTQRSKVTADWINPLSDHEDLKQLVARIRSKPRFSEQIEAYAAHVTRYQDELDPAMRALIQEELDLIGPVGGPMGSGPARASLGQVESLLNRWQAELQSSRDQVDALTPMDNPQYAAAVNAIRGTYRDFTQMLKSIQQYGEAELSRNPNLPPQAASFLSEAGARYADTVALIEAETTKLQELEPLKVDDLLRKITPNANAIVVETEDDAIVLDFSSVWPPIDPSRGGRAGFKDRAFRGEEQVTAAILRVTHKEQTAVVFVRYGGSPLFMGGFMPNQPAAPYANMKQKLEEANFLVDEWDLKSGDAPPEIDPEPTRTIYVVLKPTSPQQNPFQQRNPQDLPFSASHRQKLVDALGDEPRVLFVAGWYPGPFGPVPGSYEYNEYLKPNWGITVDQTYLVIKTTNFDVGKYGVDQTFFNMQEFEFGDHPIVDGPLVRLLTLPACAPLRVADELPEGVEATTLITVPENDEIWGVKNLQTYQEQLTNRNYMTLAEEDVYGPFDVAMAATRGDAKMVIVSARDFAADEVAFARAMAITAQGFTIRSRNPGNVTLFLNSLHWLNDNEDIMGVGQPIDPAVLEIESEKTVQTVQAITIFAWPALALLCGAVAWWTRRR